MTPAVLGGAFVSQCWAVALALVCSTLHSVQELSATLHDSVFLYRSLPQQSPACQARLHAVDLVLSGQ